MSAGLQILHWAIRGLAIFLAGLVVVLAVGEGIDIPNLDRGEAAMLAGLAVSVAGLVLLAIPPYEHRRRILAGSVLSLLGIGTFFVINYHLSGRFPGGWVFPLFFVPGVFELITAFTRSVSAKSRNVPSNESP